MKSGARRVLCLTLLIACGSARAGGGPLGIDSELRYDQSGIWSRSYSLGLEYGAVATEVVGGLWLGNDDPVGHVFWQSIDASAVSGLSAEILKKAFSRARPYQGDNPNAWFQGHDDKSFPSGEVTLQASVVTPFVVDYVRQDPWIALLEVLPVYDAVSRLKAQAHWQSDVIAGWVLGSGIGYWTTTLPVPLLVQVLPRGITVGLSKRF